MHTLLTHMQLLCFMYNTAYTYGHVTPMECHVTKVWIQSSFVNKMLPMLYMLHMILGCRRYAVPRHYY